MAIRMVQVVAQTRSRGHTAAGAVAYRHGLNLACPRTGQTHEYAVRREDGHVIAEGMAGRTPAITTPAALAVEIERTERRRNSQLLRDVQVALPVELDAPSGEALVAHMAQALAARYSTVVSWAIHRPHHGDCRNIHAHLIVPTRALDPNDPAGRLGAKLRQLCERPRSRYEIKAIRETWIRLTDEALAQAGIEVRLEAERPLVLDEQEAAPVPEEDVPPAVHPDDRLPDLTREEVAAERRAARKAGIDPTGEAIRALLLRVAEPYTRAGKILVARLARHRWEQQRPRPVDAPPPALSPARLRRIWRTRAVEAPGRASSLAVTPAALMSQGRPRPVDEPARSHTPSAPRWIGRAFTIEAPAPASSRMSSAPERFRSPVRLGERLADAEPDGHGGRDSPPEPRPGPGEPIPQDEAEQTREAAPARYRLLVVPADDPDAEWRDAGPEDVFASSQQDAMAHAIVRRWGAGQQVAIAPERDGVHYAALRGPPESVETLERAGYRPCLTVEAGAARIAVLALRLPREAPDDDRIRAEPISAWQRFHRGTLRPPRGTRLSGA